MSEIHYPLTRDGYLKAVEVESVKKSEKKKYTKTKVIGSVVLIFAISNADEFNRWIYIGGHDGMVYPLQGCNIEFMPEEDPLTGDEEKPVKNAKSAAAEFTLNTSDTDVGKIIKQGREYIADEVQEFVMYQSGINARVHAPEGVNVNSMLFSWLFHAPLAEAMMDEYKHPEVRQLMECYRERIIEDKEFEGATFDIYLAPDTGHCLRGFMFQPDVEDVACDGIGFTPPKLEFGIPGFNFIDMHPMLLSTRRTGQDANSRISATLIHESVHAYMSLTGQPFRRDPDERFVLYVAGGWNNDTKQYVEGKVIPRLFPNGVPHAISYPSTETVSVEDRG